MINAERKLLNYKQTFKPILGKRKKQMINEEDQGNYHHPFQ